MSQMESIICINKINKEMIIQKISFIIITIVLLHSCSLNKNIKAPSGLFCSSSSSSEYHYGFNFIIKLDSNNIELEEFVRTVGIRQYYGKGEWSYISKNKIVFVCDCISTWDSINNPYYISPLNWNTYAYDEYLKIISDKKIIYYEKIGKKSRKVILRSDWCDCIPDREKSIIINSQIETQTFP